MEVSISSGVPEIKRRRKKFPNSSMAPAITALVPKATRVAARMPCLMRPKMCIRDRGVSF